MRPSCKFTTTSRTGPRHGAVRRPPPMKGPPAIEEPTTSPVACKIAPLERLILIVGASPADVPGGGGVRCVQRRPAGAECWGGKVLTPPALVCGSVAVLSALIALSSRRSSVRTDTTLPVCFSLFVRHRFSLPALVKCSLVPLLPIDAGSVNWRFGQKPVCPWELGGLFLGKRRASHSLQPHFLS